jgi:hypothetical protein
MKVTCPKCKKIGRLDESKILETDFHVCCPQCQHRFPIRKKDEGRRNPSEEYGSQSDWADNYLKSSIRGTETTEAELPSDEAIISNEDLTNTLDQFYSMIRENKQKTVLFLTAGALVFMLLFPPFHMVARGFDQRIGYFFIFAPPQNRLARIDALPLLVQCFVVSVIGLILWLAFKGERVSVTQGHGSIKQKKAKTTAVVEKRKIGEDFKKRLGKSTPSTRPKTQTSSAPKGVGGWLLWFCVLLTIIGPLLSLSEIVSNWGKSAAVFSQFPSFKTAVFSENIGIFLIFLYGFIVGREIWSGNPNGKELAVQYLKIRLFGTMGLKAIMLFMLHNLPSHILGAVLVHIVGSFLYEGALFLIWWLYFKKSKRVRNTYGSQ